jgi:hypothetical protein
MRALTEDETKLLQTEINNTTLLVHQAEAADAALKVQLTRLKISCGVPLDAVFKSGDFGYEVSTPNGKQFIAYCPREDKEGLPGDAK